MEDKPILVTGGSGYIGSALVPALLAQGHRVRVFARRAPSSMVAHANLTHRIGDMRDAAAVTQAVAGVGHVIHLAGVPDGADEAATRAINETAFPHLVRAAADAGVARFIFASTSALYGDGAPSACTEEAPAKPLSGYAAQKFACETMLRAQCPTSMDYVIVRPGAVCGLAPAMRLDVLAHLLTRDACVKGEITVAGAGHYRPHLHISDLVRAFTLLLNASDAAGEIFNLASDNLTIMALAERVRALVGPQVVIHDRPTTDTRSYRIDSTKIIQKLGFSPLSGVDSAINEVRIAIQSGAIADPFDLRYYPSKRPQTA